MPWAGLGCGLLIAEDRSPVAFATSLLASKRLVHKLLGKADDEVPPSIPQPVLDKISLKMGEQVSTESLSGVSQKAASLKVDLLNQSILQIHEAKIDHGILYIFSSHTADLALILSEEIFSAFRFQFLMS